MNQPKEGLIPDIRGWLEKTGYPLEQETEAAFVRAGFQVRRGLRYPVTDERGQVKRREIDVLASLTQTVQTASAWPAEIHLAVEFAVECKHRAGKPWVAFTSTNHRFPEPGQKIVMPVVSELARLVIEAMVEHDQVQELPLFQVCERGCYSVAFAHTNGKEDTLHIALGAATMGARSRIPPRPTKALDKACCIALPVLVTDSPVVECWYEDQKWLSDDQRGVQLQQARFIRMHWHGADFTDDYLPVDVVTKEFLDDHAQAMYKGGAKLIERVAEHVPPIVEAASRKLLFDRRTRRHL